MKFIINITFFLCLLQGLKAQQIVKGLNHEKKKIHFKISQNINVSEYLNFEMLPQFGGLFAKTFNACKNKMKWKDIYNDFDFGFNIGFNCDIKERLKFMALYNIGVLKFNNASSVLANAYAVKLSINYIF